MAPSGFFAPDSQHQRSGLQAWKLFKNTAAGKGLRYRGTGRKL